MEKMYGAVVNSPKTELTELITDVQTEITVDNAAVLLQGEGIAVIGNGDVAETITYTTIEDNVLKGCVRGFQGVPRAWPSGTRIARNYTAYDHEAGIQNILELATGIADLATEVATKTQDASTTQKGITQLSSATNGTRANVAANEVAVKAVYDRVDSGYIYRGGAPADINDAVRMGAYYVNSSRANLPANAGIYGILSVTDGGNGYLKQTYTSVQYGTIYERARSESAWTVWVRMFSETGGQIIGATQISGGSLSTVAGNATNVFSTVMNTTNGLQLIIRYVRMAAGADWNTAAVDLVRRVDSTDQATLRFRGDDVLFLDSSGNWTSLRYLKTQVEYLFSGSGSPEGSVSAPPGSIYRRTTGGTGTSLYIKENGTGNTGWRGVAYA